jgi:hypothetical protein
VDDETDDEELRMLIDFHCRGEATTLGAVTDGEWKLALKSFSDEVKGYLNGVLDAAGAERAVIAERQVPPLLNDWLPESCVARVIVTQW